jgi:hypothetical protein
MVPYLLPPQGEFIVSFPRSMKHTNVVVETPLLPS